ncbi:poly-beta-1,6-N-acetyl-D-glucosamine N-deacetylase PgaB [Bordetella genomosp. 13]|uniref:poly-beta-1,6-N-acetyl-D-glucosamine N-deacetylase PgaB n=1 Tax=Bordetella genomosp. 13 TaxID=463040 RepID=UPI0011A41607|nr:poly-beta-1,6-N-acetyl-D-glucosamine N-deacetylase PgaB [Bordetella genomosp. 13]
MKFPRLLGLLLCVCMLPLSPSASAQSLFPADRDDGQTFRVLTFHDVRKNVRASFEASPDATAIDETTLLDAFTWLGSAGYHPVSLSQIVAAREGGAPLPPKPVLLTFDDGYESAYTIVFPLLKRFNYPAVMALVSGWMDAPEGVGDYGGRQAIALPKASFMTWEQAREMAQSGLVELAGHTDAMHRGVVANPQGNLLPAATSHAYDRATGRYESDQAYRTRILEDLRRNKAEIERHTGATVRAIVWPYGAYNDAAIDAARRAGMPIALSLDDGPNTPDVPLDRIRRGLINYEDQGPELLRDLRSQIPSVAATRDVNRIMHVDLDYVYDPDPAQQERNLSRLLDRVQKVQPSSVFLQAFADPDGDGVADAMYFPSRRMPMRADLFNRVAWQLRTRTGVKVYAWMPVSSFHLPESDPAADRLVRQMPGAPAGASHTYRRLSIFDPVARQAIHEIYEDLGRHAAFAGVLYHDDAMFNDFEDASPAALEVYRGWGLPADVAAIRASPELMARWTQRKTRALIDFTHDLTGILKRWQPVLATARNMYAQPLLNPPSEAYFAQNYASFLQAYDYTALEAMPFMEQAADPEAWLRELARKVTAIPGANARTLFELQARDWRTGTPIPDDVIDGQFALLHEEGVRNLGYYPDDFLNDQPSLRTIKPHLSIQRLLGREFFREPVERPGSPRERGVAIPSEEGDK